MKKIQENFGRVVVVRDPRTVRFTRYLVTNLTYCESDDDQAETNRCPCVRIRAQDRSRVLIRLRNILSSYSRINRYFIPVRASGNISRKDKNVLPQIYIHIYTYIHPDLFLYHVIPISHTIHKLRECFPRGNMTKTDASCASHSILSILLPRAAGGNRH